MNYLKNKKKSIFPLFFPFSIQKLFRNNNKRKETFLGDHNHHDQSEKENKNLLKKFQCRDL